MKQGAGSLFQVRNRQSTATFETDAALAETSKEEAQFCYQGDKAYQPLNTRRAEQGVILHSEFRDGNVPAGFELLRVLMEALDCLLQGVKKVRLRTNAGGYRHDLLRYCETGENERFGRIEFAIGYPVTAEFTSSYIHSQEDR